jgi:hypothetical protein
MNVNSLDRRSFLAAGALAPLVTPAAPGAPADPPAGVPDGVKVVDHGGGGFSTQVFRVTDQEGRLAAVHFGRELKLDRVLAALTEGLAPSPAFSGHDLTVTHDGKVAAVVRVLPGGKGHRVLAVADPAGDAEEAARKAASDDEMAGIYGATDLAVARDSNRPVAWMITEECYELYRSHYRLTLDQVLAEEVREFPGGRVGPDRAVWRGGALMAAVFAQDNGRLAVVRFDEEDENGTVRPVTREIAPPADDGEAEVSGEEPE